ncbi:MAG: ATP-binding cassette domain-containing protein [Bacteroidales bacterium]
MSREIAISAKGISYRYGKFVAVRQFNLQLFSGEVVALTGANGAGKSTTLKMLCGIYSPFEGELSVGGYDMINMRERAKRGLGYMSQSSTLLHHLTARENWLFYAIAKGLTRREMEQEYQKGYSKFKMERFAHKRVETLTAGWQRLLAFSIASIASPKVLLLDEPTAGVDALTRVEIWKSIREIAQEGSAILVTTHSLSEVAYCDKRVEIG